MSQPNGSVKSVVSYVEQNFKEFRADLEKLSRIPSISADGFPPEEVRRSAQATAEVMRKWGIENVQVLEMMNVSRTPLALHPGIRICQIVLERTE